MTLAQTTTLLTSCSKTTLFTSLVHSLADPVDARIISNGGVRWVHQDDFIVLISRVLVNPVAVQHAQVHSLASDTLLSLDTQGALRLQLNNTLSLWLTVVDTLGDLTLSATTANTHAIDDVTLLSLVTESSSLIWTGWSGCTVDDVQLSILPTTDSQQESQHIALLLLVQFFNILISTHLDSDLYKFNILMT